MDLEYLLEKEAGMEVPEDRLDEIEILELEEYLDNLGYIHIDQNKEDRPVDWPAIMVGIATFRKEYKLYHDFFSQSPKIFKFLVPLDALVNPPKEELIEEELDFLSHLSSIEGQFELHQFKKEVIQENLILNRVLNYRLGILGLVETSAAILDTSLQDAALLKLGKWAAISRYKGLVQIIGNIHALGLHLAKCNKFPTSQYKQICYIEEEKTKIRGTDDRERFESRFGTLEPESRSDFEYRRKKKDRISLIINDELNRLMCRIAQIKLWLLGVYPGKLDSDIGSMSLEAIQNMIAFLRDLIERTKGRKLKANDAIIIADVLFKLNKRQWAFNVSFLLEHVFPILIDKLQTGGGEMAMTKAEKEKIENATVAGEIGALAEKVKEQKQTQFYEDLEKTMDERTDANQKEKKRNRRKVKTRGGRDFFRSVGLFFNSLAKKISQGIGFIIKSIKKLFAWIKNGIKVLIREIKKVFKLLRKGVQFIFGKKKITTKDETTQTVITTHYDADFDSVTRMNQAKPELIATHLTKNRDILLALEECSNFLGMALFIVVHITPPVGWLKLGIKLIRYLAGTRFQYQRFSFPGQ